MRMKLLQMVLTVYRPGTTLNVIGCFLLRPAFSWKNPNAGGRRLNCLLRQTMKPWYLLTLPFGVSMQGA